MKPVSAIQNCRAGMNRRFPVIDCNYRSLEFSELKTRCAGAPRPSFEKISLNYFNVEARRNFALEALVFVLVASATVPAIVDCARALITFVQAIGGM